MKMKECIGLMTFVANYAQTTHEGRGQHKPRILGMRKRDLYPLSLISGDKGVNLLKSEQRCRKQEPPQQSLTPKSVRQHGIIHGMGTLEVLLSCLVCYALKIEISSPTQAGRELKTDSNDGDNERCYDSIFFMLILHHYLSSLLKFLEVLYGVEAKINSLTGSSEF